MYLFFRLLSLVALLSLIAGFVVKFGNFGDATVLFRIGIIAACIGWAGRFYLDRKKKAH